MPVAGPDRILVVEADRELAVVIDEVLARAGYERLVVHGAAEATARLDAGDVAVAVLDLDTSGLELLRHAAGLPARPDVVLLTAHPTLDSALAAIDTEVAGYLTKPFAPSRLVELVAGVMERRALVRENERLSAELADRLAHAESLLAISSTIGSPLDLDEALRRICRELVRLTGADTAAAYLHDTARDLLVPTAAYHVPKEHVEALSRATIPLREQGFYLPPWTTRRPVHTTDVAADARFGHVLFRQLPHQSGLVLPLIIDDEVAGAFYLVWWKRRRSLADAELAHLEQVGAQVNVLLRNARLYAQAERDRRRLDTLYEVSRRLAAIHDTDQILSLIVNEATRLLSAEGAGLRLVEDDELVLAARTESAAGVMQRPRLRIGESLSGIVVATGEPLAVEDLLADTRHDPAHKRGALERGFHGFLGVPLRAHGQTVGVLNVFTLTRRRFHPEEISLLAAFADQASLAIEKGRLLREAEQGRLLLERLYEGALAMQTSWDAATRLQAFVEAAHGVVGFDRVNVLLATPDGQGLELVTAHGAGETVPPARLPLAPAAGAFYQAFQTRRPVAVLSDEDLARVAPLDPALRAHPTFRTRRFVVAPLVVGERAVGVVSADNKWSRRPISPAALEPFRLLCQQLAMALEDARLYAEARAREQEATKLVRGLTVLGEASRALYRTLEVDAMLHGALDALARTFGAGAVLVNLLTEHGALRASIGRWLSEAHGRDVGFRTRGGITELVRTSREPLILPDIAARPDVVHPAHAAHGVTSLAAFPIVGQGGRVLGALFLYYTERQAFPESEVRLLSAYAGQLATALENAQLYEDAESQRTRLRLIFDSTSDGIVLLGGDGRIEAANRRAAELLGFERAAATGTDLLAALAGRFRSPDFARAEAAFRALLAAPERGGQGDLEMGEPSRRVMAWVGQPTRNAAGATIGLTLTFRDVTEEREVSQMKSDFVSFVTHQLRTPLAGIKWLLELAVQEPGVPEGTRSYVEDAREANERLIRLVNDLLNVSRLEGGKIVMAPRAIDLRALTVSVLDELAPLLRDKGHRLTVDADPGLPPIVVDPQLLRQVILNLVSNAIKYTKPGGEVAVRIGQDGPRVRWSVQDSGIGIPKDAQRRLFEKFFRAENVLTLETEGTGLGLYLVRLILEQAGGRVACESEEGRGSTFVFTLPLPGGER